MWLSASPCTFIAKLSIAKWSPREVSSSGCPIIRCSAGSGLSGPGTVSTGAASVTVRPVRTSRVAASTRAGVSATRAPRSPAAQAVRERSWRYSAPNSSSVSRGGPAGRACVTMGQRPLSASSASSRVVAAMMSDRCVNACGKLPSCSPLGPISSAKSPTWLAWVCIFSNV